MGTTDPFLKKKKKTITLKNLTLRIHILFIMVTRTHSIGKKYLKLIITPVHPIKLNITKRRILNIIPII